MQAMTTSLPFQALRAAFGDGLQESVPLARYTSARIGGPAAALLTVHLADELAATIQRLWETDAPYFILGGGSNVLVSDAGVQAVVVLNRAKSVRFDESGDTPTVWAESGASFGGIARQAGQKGLSGLEWAAGIPGTLGGAVVGNAGAHGGEVADNLVLAEILHHREGRQPWTAEQLAFGYRSSALKRDPEKAVVLSATLKLAPGMPEAIEEKMDSFLAYRRQTQPPGASMGSMFKNPPGDYAGRLIEAAGLKGHQVGAAQISELHANFFVNLGGASASDVYALIDTARRAVNEQFGVQLELEIELVGDWQQFE